MKKIISIESAFQFFKEIKLNEEETKVFFKWWEACS